MNFILTKKKFNYIKISGGINMKKKLFILIILVLSYVLSANEFKTNDFKFQKISFVKTFEAISNQSLTKYASSSESSNELTNHKNLFLGLTIAFGAGACTFLLLGIILGSVYSAVPFGINYERVQHNNTGVDNWSNSQYALLAGTICAWALFSFTAVLAVATFILYMIATDLFGSTKDTNKKKAMLKISPSNDKMDILVSVKF